MLKGLVLQMGNDLSSMKKEVDICVLGVYHRIPPKTKHKHLAEAVQVQRFSLRNTLDKLLPRLNGRKGIWLEI